jgi:hypothetical protein
LSGDEADVISVATAARLEHATSAPARNNQGNHAPGWCEPYVICIRGNYSYKSWKGILAKRSQKLPTQSDAGHDGKRTDKHQSDAGYSKGGAHQAPQNGKYG